MTNEEKFEKVFGASLSHSGFIYDDFVKGRKRDWWMQEFHSPDAKDNESPVSDRKLMIVATNYESEYKELGRQIFMRGLKMGYEKARRFGRWIPEDDGFGGEIWNCSVCNAVWTFNDGGPLENNAFFCPECGADMRPLDEGNSED